MNNRPWFRNDIPPYPEGKTLDQIRSDYRASRPVPVELLEKVFLHDLGKLRVRYAREESKVRWCTNKGLRHKDRRAMLQDEIDELVIKLERLTGSGDTKTLYYVGRQND